MYFSKAVSTSIGFDSFCHDFSRSEPLARKSARVLCEPDLSDRWRFASGAFAVKTVSSALLQITLDNIV